MKRVAVLGIKDAEPDPDAPAHTIPLMMSRLGIEMTGVNPRVPHALGQPTLASLDELPPGIDVLNVFRRSEAIPELADSILALPLERRPRVVWLQSGIRHEDATARLTEAGITVIQDACLGVYAKRYRR